MTSNPSPRIIGGRAARNPILAEKTPRTIYQEKKWSYEPPKGEKIKEKWNYIDEDIGLVSQLGSMTDKVAKENARIELYNQRIKQFEEQQKNNKNELSMRTGRSSSSSSQLLQDQQQYQQISSSSSSSSRLDTGRSQSTSRLTESGRFETDRTITSRSLQPINETSRKDKTLLDFPVASIKTLQSSHPEILAKLRAERAAKYVESLSNPLNPPAYDHVSARGAFRPGGGTLKYNNSGEFPELRVTQKKKLNSSDGNNKQNSIPEEPLTTERIKDNLKSLVKILEETDNQIAKQDLKIALSKKVKTYEKKGDYNKRSAREG